MCQYSHIYSSIVKCANMVMCIMTLLGVSIRSCVSHCYVCQYRHVYHGIVRSVDMVMYVPVLLGMSIKSCVSWYC